MEDIKSTNPAQMLDPNFEQLLKLAELNKDQADSKVYVGSPIRIHAFSEMIIQKLGKIPDNVVLLEVPESTLENIDEVYEVTDPEIKNQILNRAFGTKHTMATYHHGPNRQQRRQYLKSAKLDAKRAAKKSIIHKRKKK